MSKPSQTVARTFRALSGLTLATVLLLTVVVTGSSAATAGPQDAEIRAAFSQAVAGTELSIPDETLFEGSNYRWTVGFDDFRANLFPGAPDAFTSGPLWDDYASWLSVSIALDGAFMTGDSRVGPTRNDTTICGQPTERNLHPVGAQELQYAQTVELSMGAGHEAELGPDRPRGPEVFHSNGSVYFVLGRFFFNVSAGSYDSTQGAAIQQVEQALATIGDGLCTAFTPLVEVVSTTSTAVVPSTPATPPVTLPTGPVTLQAAGPGWSTDVETVPNPEAFGLLEVDGRVIDLADSSGVVGVTVSVTSGGSGSVVTGQDGRFTIGVTVPGGTPDTGVMSGVQLELSRLAGLDAVAVPSSFTAVDETAEITATLTDDTGAPLTGVDLTLTPLDPPGVQRSAGTGVDGTARFSVTHDDPSRSSYSWAVTAPGGERVEVLVQVVGLIVETNPSTGEPFEGVVADSTSSLELDLRLPADNRIAFVSSPTLGTLRHDGQELGVDGVVELDQGRATLVYTPPDYLTKELLTGRHAVTRPDGTVSNLRVAPEVLRVGYDDAEGQRIDVRADLLLARPPVMLVHGFTGNSNTWAKLENYLTAAGMDAVTGDYISYEGGLENTSIQYQSIKLRDNIAGQRGAYAAAGLRLGKVDIVAHSMGGLISRHYIEEAPDYAGDVRKLIMAGTPNHGSGPLDAKIASLASLVFNGHQVAGQQLRSGSPFLRVLNDGEVDGSHLNRDVQYANLIGRRSTLFGASFGVPYANDDGVVTVASATLNGVRSWVYDGIKHSKAVVVYGDAGITEAYEIFAQVTTLLASDIPRATLSGERMELVAAAGAVSVGAPVDDAARPAGTLPRRLLGGDRIETGPVGAAVVHLSIHGTLWGVIDVAPSSEVVLAEASPRHVLVRLVAGQARLRSAHPDAGVFDVLIGPESTDPDGWFNVYPEARITDLDTSFVVAADPPGVWGLAGAAVAEAGGSVERVDAGGGLQLQSGTWESATAPELWWQDDAYVVDADTVLGVPVVAIYILAVLLLLAGVVLVVVFVLADMRSRGAVPLVAAIALIGATGVFATTVVLRDVDELPDHDVVLLLPEVPETEAAADLTSTPSGPATPPPTQAATTSCTTSNGVVLVYDAAWQVFDDEDPEFDCTLFDRGPMPTFAEADFAAVIVSPSPGLTFDDSKILFDDPSMSVLTREEMFVDGLRAYRSEIGPGADANAKNAAMVFWSIETSPITTLFVTVGGYATHEEAVTFGDQLVISSDWAMDG